MAEGVNPQSGGGERGGEDISQNEAQEAWNQWFNNLSLHQEDWEEIEKQQFEDLDKALTREGRFVTAEESGQLEKIRALVEKYRSKKGFSKRWGLVWAAGKARRQANRGRYYVAQEAFAELRAVYQEVEEREWYE